MTNNIRVFLWLGLALALWLNFSQWQQDYGPKPAPSVASTASPGASKPAALEDTVPQVPQTAASTATGSGTAVPTATPDATQGTPVESAGIVHVSTDVLEIDIDLKGGALVRAELPGYPLVKGQPDPVVLLNRDRPETNYILQTGLAANTKDTHAPTHLEVFSSAAGKYALAPGQDELHVPLTWTDGDGVNVTKTFVFHRGSFAIRVEYSVDNKSPVPWSASAYAQIVRTDPPVERSMFHVESYAFRGPAIWAADKPGGSNLYHRLKLDKPDDVKIAPDVTGGWIAGMQHHFVTAVIPEPTEKYSFKLTSENLKYVLAAAGPATVVAPGATGTIKETLFVGPKLQEQLVAINPELFRVADYGTLAVISRPLFRLLALIHDFVKNWGVTIILATFLLKLAFYPLSEKAGRSMARMRALAPRLKLLQEQYKDDRSKLGQATMELYKTEKVNPVSGCLPMLIQMPVFLAFYWVLLESAEMRQAPFLGWINDLSSRDPYFILPALNGLAMFAQQKMNPPPPDPMQAKLFQFMPVVFSVMFAFAPAGLVLYWVTNTGLGILQQWNINRKIASEDKARRR